MVAIVRLPLLPFAIVAELVLLATGWILALANPAAAARLVRWVGERFPGRDWYLGRSQALVGGLDGGYPLRDFEPYASIIGCALANSGTAKGDRRPHPRYEVPIYIVDMCQALVHAVNDAGGGPMTLAEMIRLERTCTGADYSHKLAMRCHQLARCSAHKEQTA